VPQSGDLIAGRKEILGAEEILRAEAKNLESPPLQDLGCPKGFLFAGRNAGERQNKNAGFLHARFQ
jgi:hypothetical protein